MKTKQNLISIAIITSICLATIGCNDKSEVVPIKNNSAYLEFNSQDDFYKLINKDSLPGAKLESIYSSNPDFESYTEVYDSALTSAKKYILDNFSDVDTLSINKRNAEDKINAILKKHSKYLTLTENGVTTDIINSDYMALVNKDKVAKIGTQLFQFNNNNIKIILDGDYSKVSMLDNFDETDSSKSIVVQKNVKVNIQTNTYSNFRTEASISSVSQVKNQFRLIIYEQLAYQNCSAIYFLSFRSLERFIFWWLDAPTGPITCGGFYTSPQMTNNIRTTYSGRGNHPHPGTSPSQNYTIIAYRTFTCNPQVTIPSAQYFAFGIGGVNPSRTR